MAVNVKLGVELGDFTSQIKTGQTVLKSLNAEMKAADAEFKATGNAEKQLADKTKTLNSQLQVQKGIADQAKQALKAMDDAGVKPTDASYQKLYATMMNATAGMNEAQAQLNALGRSAQGAAAGADQLTNSVNSIGKKISLEQVISGIDTIKSGLESAAKKAVQLGETIWNNVMDSARLSDDILTQAGILDMTPEQYQKYKGVFNTIGEVTISEWAATKRKIEKAMVDPSSDQMDVFRTLGLTGMGGKGSNTEILNIADNWEDVFWQVGSELQKRVESGEMSSAMADVYGEALFGKKYSSMKNLLKLGQEGFEAALNEQNIISDEALEKNAALNDAVIKLQDSFEALKAEVTSALAPALTDAAKALDGVLGKILEYLKTEKGKEMLAQLGDAISGLFGDLSKIDPEKVVAGFVEVFTKVTGGIQWLVDNAETAKGILAAIVGAWGAITIGESVLKIMNLVNGIKGLTGSAAASAGAEAGASWGGAFASAVAAAAPWLIGLYTLLNPAGSAKDNIDTLYQSGQLTEGGLEFWKNNLDVWEARQNAIAQRYGNFASLMGNDQALQIMLDPTIDDEAVFKRLEEELGLQPKPIGINAELILPEDTAKTLSDAVGTVVINGVIHLTDENGNVTGVSSEWLGTGETTNSKRTRTPTLPGHANGLFSVPYDGYLARLHRGERVVPAREIQSRSYNSNLYVESMYMNNGTDAAGLASAMAAAQQRTMSGYGS